MTHKDALEALDTIVNELPYLLWEKVEEEIQTVRQSLQSQPCVDVPIGGEEWLPIPRCEGYEASNFGNIRKITIYKRSIDNRGYARCSVIEGGVRKNRKVASLVARAYHGEMPEDCTLVRHLNGDRLDDRPHNLRYGTHKDNYADAKDHGTHSHGEIHGNSKLNEASVKEIREKYAKGDTSYQKLGDEYGVDRHTIKLVVKRKNWPHVK